MVSVDVKRHFNNNSIFSSNSQKCLVSVGGGGDDFFWGTGVGRGGGGGEGVLFSPARVAFAETIPIFVSLTMALESFQSFQKTVQTRGLSLSTPLRQMTDGVNVFDFVSAGTVSRSSTQPFQIFMPRTVHRQESSTVDVER